MSLKTFADALPDYAKDLRLNVGSLLNDQTLGDQRKYGLLLSCAHGTGYKPIVEAAEAECAGKLSPERQALERSRPWRRGYRWRAGIEGRIASLRRDFGWRKSAYHGQDGMERWLGLGVMASNLRRIALAK